MHQKIPNMNLQILHLSSQIYLESQCNLNQNPNRVFSCVEITKLILKFILKSKHPRTARVIVKKNEVATTIRYQASLENCTKTVKLAKRETDQWNRTENAEIDPLAELM